MGADPEGLMRRGGTQFVLNHSYRLPRAIHGQARQIIRRIRDRVQTDFEPDREGGTVERAWDWVDLPFEREGSWLLLARNRVFLEDVRQQLTRAGVAFRDRTSDAGVPDPDGPLGRAVDAALRLAAGEVLPKMRLRALRRLLRDDDLWPRDGIAGPGALVDLEGMGAAPALAATLRQRPLAALDMPPAMLDYLEAIVSREGHLSAPRVELGTIHSFKGEEGAHVAASTAMTNRTYEEYQADPADAHRCFYVAATRARESLTWLMNGGRGYVV